MDDFARAVELSLDASGSEQQKQEALEWLEQFSASPNSWAYCAENFANNVYVDGATRLYSLNIVESFVRTRYEDAEPDQRLSLRHMLLMYVQQPELEKEPAFIRNKIAHLLALIFTNEFPSMWPDFFADMHALLDVSPAMVDIYLRVLQAIDEVVVDRDFQRTAVELTRNSALKDAMREHAMSTVAQDWLSILTAHQAGGDASTCVLCLDIVRAYTSWIDIGLVANARLIPLLFSFLEADEERRDGACAVLQAIAAKGMDVDLKTSLFAELDIVGVVMRVTSAMEGNLCESIGKLVNLMGVVLLEGAEKQQLSLPTLEMVLAIVPLLCVYLADADDDVSATVLEFANLYARLLKHQEPTPTTLDHLQQMLTAVVSKLMYDADTLFSGEDEDLAYFQNFRRDLKTLFSNIGACSKELVLQHVHDMVESILSQDSLPSRSWMEVELVLHCVRLLGTVFVGQVDEDCPIVHLLGPVIDSGVAQFDHRAVTLEFFDVIQRYSNYFTMAQHHIEPMLALFLGPVGLGNSDITVQRRACYIFSAIFGRNEGLRPLMAVFVDEIFGIVGPLLRLEEQHKGITHDDLSNLHEGVSWILGHAPAPSRHAHLTATLEPLLLKFEAILSERLPYAADLQAQRECVEVLSYIIGAATRLSKGLSREALLEANCLDLFDKSVRTFLHALVSPVQRSAIHSCVLTFLHRMIIVLDDGILPLIPTVVSALVVTPELDDLVAFVLFINHLLGKFKAKFAPYLSDFLLEFVQTIFAALMSEVDENDFATLEEKTQLRRHYFGFVNAIVNNGLAPVIMSQENAALAQELLATLSGGLADASDPKAQRACAQTLCNYSKLFLSGSHASEFFQQFMLSEALPATFSGFLSDVFDFEDAQAMLALTEMAALHLTATTHLGMAVATCFEENCFPIYGITPDLGQELIKVLVQGPKKRQYASALKEFITQARS